MRFLSKSGRSGSIVIWSARFQFVFERIDASDRRHDERDDHAGDHPRHPHAFRCHPSLLALLLVLPVRRCIAVEQTPRALSSTWGVCFAASRVPWPGDRSS
jgi:hypothetical protein